MRSISHFINGQSVTRTGAFTSPVYDPSTGQVQAHLEHGDAPVLAEAVAVAKAAQPAWYRVTPYREPGDWVFASNSRRSGKNHGKQPLWLQTVMRCHIEPVVREPDIQKRVSWHTFRRTYTSLLHANGEDVKVVQELLRHGSAKMTLDVYAQAQMPAKRRASFMDAAPFVQRMPDIPAFSATTALNTPRSLLAADRIRGRIGTSSKPTRQWTAIRASGRRSVNRSKDLCRAVSPDELRREKPNSPLQRTFTGRRRRRHDGMVWSPQQ